MSHHWELNQWYSTQDLMKYELSPFLVSVVGTKAMQLLTCAGGSVPHFYHDFLVLSEERTLSDLSSGFILFQMPEEAFQNN